MANTQASVRRARSRYRLLDVRAVERITPRTVRVTLAGPELDDFVSNGSDQRIKLCLPRPGRPMPLGRTREEVFALPREQQPLQRTYTVRPSPAYRPDPAADPLVLAGDETALPAMAAILEELPAGSLVRVFAEVADAAEQQRVGTVANVDWTWLHRDGVPAGESRLLVDAVRTTDLDPDPHVWLGAEAGVVHELRASAGRARPTAAAATRWRTGGGDRSSAAQLRFHLRSDPTTFGPARHFGIDDLHDLPHLLHAGLLAQLVGNLPDRVGHQLGQLVLAQRSR